MWLQSAVCAHGSQLVERASTQVPQVWPSAQAQPALPAFPPCIPSVCHAVQVTVPTPSPILIHPTPLTSPPLPPQAYRYDLDRPGWSPDWLAPEVLDQLRTDHEARQALEAEVQVRSRISGGAIAQCGPRAQTLRMGYYVSRRERLLHLHTPLALLPAQPWMPPPPPAPHPSPQQLEEDQRVLQTEVLRSGDTGCNLPVNLKRLIENAQRKFGCRPQRRGHTGEAGMPVPAACIKCSWHRNLDVYCILKLCLKRRCGSFSFPLLSCPSNPNPNSPRPGPAGCGAPRAGAVRQAAGAAGRESPACLAGGWAGWAGLASAPA